MNPIENDVPLKKKHFCDKFKTISQLEWNQEYLSGLNMSEMTSTASTTTPLSPVDAILFVLVILVSLASGIYQVIIAFYLFLFIVAWAHRTKLQNNVKLTMQGTNQGSNSTFDSGSTYANLKAKSLLELLFLYFRAFIKPKPIHHLIK